VIRRSESQQQGLNDDENGLRFFFMWVALVMIEFSAGNFIRFISCMFKDVATVQGLIVSLLLILSSSCSAVAPGLLIVGIFYAGFIIARDNIPCMTNLLLFFAIIHADWFIWIHYITPFKYCFEALMINEFVGLGFKGPFGVLDGLLAFYVLRCDSHDASGRAFLESRFFIDYSDPESFKWFVHIIVIIFLISNPG
jgi:hypothetical protein